jgi:hypothetical protein
MVSGCIQDQVLILGVQFWPDAHRSTIMLEHHYHDNNKPLVVQKLFLPACARVCTKTN